MADLLLASKRGDDDSIRALLADGKVSLTFSDPCGLTAFAWACLERRSSAVRILHRALEDQDTELTRLEASAYAMYLLGDHCPPPALAAAALAGRPSSVAALCAAGEDYNVVWEEYTPLFIAACFGHGDVVRELLDAGADPEGAGRGSSPLQAAVAGDFSDIVGMLLTAGAQLGPGEGARTLLELARSAVVRHQLTAHLAPDPGHTARLAFAGLTDELAAALAEGQDPLERWQDQTPIQWAARAGRTETAQLLLVAGAELDDTPSPLTIAVQHAHESTVRALLSAGADALAVDDDGLSVLDHVSTAAVAQLLAPHYVGAPGHFCCLARWGCVNEIQAALAQGADADERLAELTPLMWAAKYGHADTLRVLLDAGADVDATAAGKTARMLAELSEAPGAADVIALLDGVKTNSTNLES